MARRPRVLWLQGVTCNGDSHSFLNASEMPQILEKFHFVYHPLFETGYTLESIAKEYFDIDILVIEGGLLKKGFKRAGVESFELIERYASIAKQIVCAGNCASFGGISRKMDRNVTGAAFCEQEPTGLLASYSSKIINLPGCPIHPQWLVYALEMNRHGQTIELDEFRRPVELYGYTVHEGCTRNEYFEWKIDAKGFGVREGCLFYEHGCQGPFTHGSCNKILWGGVSSKTRAGMPCIGCTEPGFPSTNLFETKTLMSIPAKMPLGVPKRAYLTMTGIAKAFKIERLEKKKF
ncbi:NADH-quinone oxidoreductase subunit B family protein [Hydrogenimonas sp.]